MTMEDTRTALKRRTVLAAAISALGLAAAPQAGAIAPEPVDLQVIDRDTGQAAQVWRRNGRAYVAGRPGALYSLRVTNNTPGRIMVVMSVDGVNILTGETAGYGQRGYVFDPYQSYDVSGWRKSDTEVAAFTFAPLPRSYAARTGRPNDVGVIGIAAFTERVARPYAQSPAVSLESRARRADLADEDVVASGNRVSPSAPPSAALAPRAAELAQRSEKLGTGHGEREWSAVRTVSFQRATVHPQFIRQIEYDSYANLVAGGVIPRPRPVPPRPPRPRPFPGNGYVPDPPGRG